MYKNRIYGKILFIIVSENIKYPRINLIISNKSNRLIRINLINTFNKIFVKTLVPGILQPRILEWVVLSLSAPGDLTDTRVKPGSTALQADSLPFEGPGKPNIQIHIFYLWLSVHRSGSNS